MGWSDRVGAVEAGRFGDLIAVRGNPLEDVGVLQRVEVVVKGGLLLHVAQASLPVVPGEENRGLEGRATSAARASLPVIPGEDNHGLEGRATPRHRCTHPPCSG